MPGTHHCSPWAFAPTAEAGHERAATGPGGRRLGEPAAVLAEQQVPEDREVDVEDGSLGISAPVR